MDILLNIIIIGSLSLALSLLYKFILDKKYEEREEDIKNYLDVIISLNISHLHDASNFFSLIKNDLPEGDTKNFAKGAAYHFRSIFDELKGTKEFFDLADFDNLLKNKVHLFYKKEIIDLKDLLELELFQVSNFKRLKIKDSTVKDSAATYGNFTLLSKVILNLVENALKYTNEDILIELKDPDPDARSSCYELKILSFGEGISESLVTEIRNPKAIGHGLSSLVDIMDYHNADFEIDTIKGSGTCINLKFKKYHKQLIEDEEDDIESLGFGANDWSSKVINKLKSRSHFFRPYLSLPVKLLGAFLIFIIFISVSWVNNMLVDRHYDSYLVKAIRSSKQINGFRHKRQEIEADLKKMNQLMNDSKISSYLDLEDDFIKQFDKEDRSLVRLILFRNLENKKNIYIQDFIVKRAQELQTVYPNYVDLNYSLSDLYWERNNYLLGSIYSLQVLMSLPISSVVPNKDVYLLENMYKDKRIEKHLVAKFLVSLSSAFKSKRTKYVVKKENTSNLMQGWIIKNFQAKTIDINKKAISSKPVVQKKQLIVQYGPKYDKKLIEENVALAKEPNEQLKKKQAPLPVSAALIDASDKKTIKSLEKMIEKQDKELGLDLDL